MTINRGDNIRLAFDLGTGLASLVISGILEYQRAKSRAVGSSDREFNEHAAMFFDNAIKTWELAKNKKKSDQLELNFSGE